MIRTAAKRNATGRRGFTLTEILIAMAIFALGGVSIIALFIANVTLSRQAMDQTRAAEITRNIRSLITASLGRPLVLPDGRKIYRFDYPGSSLTFLPSQMLQLEGDAEDYGIKPEQVERLTGDAKENAVYFMLPEKPFDANVSGEDALKQVMTTLPADALDHRGNNRQADVNPEVFRLTPDDLRSTGLFKRYDPDDRIFYTFSFSIRRSVMRAGVDDVNSRAKAPLEDLYVVHVKIYKGFVFAQENGGVEVDNRSNLIFEWDFYVAAAR